ncbi:hypothetical protein SprV_0301210400 [Sparganum proliferum]
MKLHPGGGYFYFVCLESLFLAKALSEGQKLSVGFIIEGESQSWALAFQKATEAANQTLAELMVGQPHKLRLVPVLKRIETGNAFAATKAACELLREPVIAIFGPNSGTASAQALRVSQKHGIPYVVTRWGDDDQPLHNVSINLHPSESEVGHTLRRFVERAEEWKQLGLIYTDDEGLQKFESLLSHFKGEVIMRKWDSNDLAHKYVIKYFRTTMSQFRFVVDIPQSEIPEFLDLIAEYNMTSQYYSYIFTDWDTQFLNPKAFAIDKGANFSALSLINITWLQDHLQQGNRYFLSRPSKGGLSADSETTSSHEKLTNYLLILDTLHLLAVGIARLASAMSLPLDPPMDLNCNSDTAWILGPKLAQTMKSGHPDVPSGFTGRMEFDDLGRRKDMNITIWEINKDGFQEYGYYNQKDDIVVTKQFATTQAQIQKELKGQTLRVSTIEDKPFVMYKGQLTASGEKSTDPKDWHGFCIDLLNECAAALQFNYTVHPVADGTYGSATLINGVEVWDGIIGELQFKKADLAVAMLTINYERERVIDFTTPFMNLGVSIIFKKPVGKQPDLFAFLRPLSPTVWGYVLIAYVGVSMALFFVGRFSPYEWHNPHPCNVDSELLENTFNMLNSLWFTIGSLMQQGSDILPRATSTRIVSGFWWFFTLIIISSYTANLAAFLTVERMKAPIEDVNDLAKQTKIKYGTRDGGSSAAFFEKSNVSTYQRMWQFMSSHKNVMMNNTEEAIARVKRGGYAYILESTINEYYTQRDCELMQVGNNLDSKGYGIGFPQGSKYRDAFSEVILALQRSQTLEEMRRYWWRNYSITQPCNEQPTKVSDTNSLGVEQVGGCFVMVLIGLGASFLISLSEFLYKAYQRSKTSKRSLREEVAREFRFSMARSSTRDFGAESALALPPPPSKCLLSSKECRVAAMAYAPCLPAAVRPADGDDPNASTVHSSDRRRSVFDVTLMHRRCSSNRRSRNSNSGGDVSSVNAVTPHERIISFATDLGGPSNSSHPTQLASANAGLLSPGDDWRYSPSPPHAHPPPAPPKSFDSKQMYNPPVSLEHETVLHGQSGVLSMEPRLPFPDGGFGVTGYRNHGDVQVKTFTC